MNNEDSDGGWETNLSSWKQRRKSHSKYQHVQSIVEEELDKVQRKPKTFKEMMLASEQKNHSILGYEDSLDHDSAAGNVFAPVELSANGAPSPDLNNSKNLFAKNMTSDGTGSQRSSRSFDATDNIASSLRADNEGRIPTKRYCDKTIKISQRPNNEKGFGFSLSGGYELNLPVTVEKVVRGGSADVCELKSGDEIIAINGADVSSDTMPSIQSIIAQAISVGQIELRVRRLAKHDDEDQDEFSDEEFEKVNFQRLSSRHHSIQHFPETSESRESSSDHLDMDDEPPPLPSVPPPPPLDIAGVESFQSDLFPSPPPNVRSTGVDQVLEFNMGVSTRGDPDNGREDLLRKKFEFLGLKPEDSEEYRVVQQDKERELHSAAVQSQPLIKRELVEINEPSLLNSDPNNSLHETFVNDKVTVANIMNSQHINKNLESSQHEFHPIAEQSSYKAMDINKMSLENNNSLKYSSNIVKEDSLVRPTPLTELTKRPDLFQEQQRAGGSQSDREEILWNRRNSERLINQSYEPRTEVEQLKYKENYLKTAQEKIDAENEIYKQEKERLMEEREQQRLQRYVVPGGRSQALGMNSNTVVGANKKFESQPIHRSNEKFTQNFPNSKQLEAVIRHDPVPENKMSTGMVTNTRNSELRSESGGESSMPSTWAAISSNVRQEGALLNASSNHSSQQDFAEKRHKFENVPVESNKITSKPSGQTNLSGKQSSSAALNPPVEKPPYGVSAKYAPYLSERETIDFVDREYDTKPDSEGRHLTGGDTSMPYQHSGSENQYSKTYDLVRRQNSSFDQKGRQYPDFHEPPRPQSSVDNKMDGRQFLDGTDYETRQRGSVSPSIDSHVGQPMSSSQTRSNRLSSAGYGDQKDVLSSGYGNQPWQRDVLPGSYVNQPPWHSSTAVAHENKLPQQKSSFAKSSAYHDTLPLSSSGMPVEQNSQFSSRSSAQQKISESMPKIETQYPDVYKNAYASHGVTAGQPVLGGYVAKPVADHSALDEIFDNTYRTRATLRESQKPSVGSLQSGNDLSPQMYGARPLDDGYQMGASQKPYNTFQQLPSQEPYRTSGDVLGTQKARPPSLSAGAYETQPFTPEALRMHPASPGAGAYATQPQVDAHGPLLKTQFSLSSADPYRVQPPVSAYSLVRYGNQSPSADPRGPYKAKDPPVRGSFTTPPTNFPGPLKTQLSSEPYKAHPLASSTNLPGYAMYKSMAGTSADDATGHYYDGPSLSQSYSGPSLATSQKSRTLGGSTGQMWGNAGQDPKQQMMSSRPTPQLSQQFSYASQPDLPSSYVDPSRGYHQSKLLTEPVLHSRSSSNPVALVPPQRGLAQSEAVNSLFAYHSQNISEFPAGRSQNTEYTNRYVPPSDAVQYITGVATAPIKPSRATQQPVPTHLGQPLGYVDYNGKHLDLTKISREQPDLYFDSNEDMYCSVCQRPLYDSLVRIIGSKLLCDNCHKSYAGNLKTSQI